MTVPATPAVSPAQSDAAPAKPRRLRVIRRIRLSTLLFLIVVAAMLFGLYAMKRRQAQLLAALSLYRNPRTEGFYEALDQPSTLTYAEGATLDVVLRQIKAQFATNPKTLTSIPMYVDPIGLHEAGVRLNSPIKRPPSADTLALGEHLARILDSLGLAYQVKDGFLMITSKESNDVPLGDDGKDLFLRYRDVLE
jgi:hypothetical protein